MIQKEPGLIIGPITRLLGFVFNFIFDIVNNITETNTLGISIIIITVIVRLLTWPLSIKQVKNSIKMQRVQPEINKLRQRYANQKDAESQKRFNLEIQRLYAENKISPASGCLLAFIQLPIFMALNQLLANSYIYISYIGIIYKDLAKKIISVPDYIPKIKPLAIPKVPSNMQIDLSKITDLQKVINKFTSSDWISFLSKLDPSLKSQIKNILVHKESTENFLGIDLIDPCGLKFPGVIIPILSVITTFLSSYFINKSMPQDNNVQKEQKNIFLLVMPLMMGMLSLTLSSGVGVYWITSSIMQLIQQYFANKYRKRQQEER